MKKTSVSLPVTIFKEGGLFVAFTPALDLATSGASISEARRNFAEAVDIFFEETERKQTTKAALLSLGWEERGDGITPPIEVAHSSASFSVPVG